jgi:hypothetical protein
MRSLQFISSYSSWQVLIVYKTYYCGYKFDVQKLIIHTSDITPCRVRNYFSLRFIKYLAYRKFHKKVSDLGNVYILSCSNFLYVGPLLRKLLNSIVLHLKQGLYYVNMNHHAVQTLVPNFIEIGSVFSEIKHANRRKDRQDVQIVCPFYTLSAKNP